MPANAEILKDPYFEMNSIVLSGQVKSLTLPFTIEEIEKVASGDNTRIKMPGLENWNATAELYNSFGAGSVDETMWNAKGTVVTFKFRKSQAAIAVNNPEYSSTGFVSQDQIIGGQVGQSHMRPVNIAAAGDLARATV